MPVTISATETESRSLLTHQCRFPRSLGSPSISRPPKRSASEGLDSLPCCDCSQPLLARRDRYLLDLLLPSTHLLQQTGRAVRGELQARLERAGASAPVV